jgi:hypothetical protein
VYRQANTIDMSFLLNVCNKNFWDYFFSDCNFITKIFFNNFIVINNIKIPIIYIKIKENSNKILDYSPIFSIFLLKLFNLSQILKLKSLYLLWLKFKSIQVLYPPILEYQF